MTYDLELPCHPDSVGQARDAAGRLDGELSARRMGDLRLLVSEVVTNAIRHAGLQTGDTIRVSFRLDEARLRVEVTDPGRGFEPAPRRPDLAHGGGWGLYLVERLASRWGVAQGTAHVWFEIPGRRTAVGAG